MSYMYIEIYLEFVKVNEVIKCCTLLKKAGFVLFEM